MRFIGLLFILICLFSCKKETSDPPVVVEEEKYFVVGNDSGSVNFKIVPFSLADIDSTHYGGKRVDYYFDFPNYNGPRITKGFQDWDNGSSRRYDNFIYIHGAEHFLADSVSEQLTVSESHMADSTYYLSEKSLLTDLPEIIERHNHISYYAIPFKQGDTIVIRKEDSRWRRINQVNVGGLVQNIPLYWHYHYGRLNINRDSTTRFVLDERYYPAWAGLEKRYLVFNYAKYSYPSDKPENIKIGWLKVSVGEEGSLKVHEVAHQVE